MAISRALRTPIRVFTFFATGNRWRQKSYHYHCHYAFMPQVQVVERNGRQFLEVAGVGVSIDVERVWCAVGDREGFDSDDDFDAMMGVLSMLQVVTGQRTVRVPDVDDVRKIEGWILGQPISTASRLSHAAGPDRRNFSVPIPARPSGRGRAA